MIRIVFICLITVALLSTDPLVEAQQSSKVWRIGLFHVGLDHVPPSLHASGKA